MAPEPSYSVADALTACLCGSGRGEHLNRKIRLVLRLGVSGMEGVRGLRPSGGRLWCSRASRVGEQRGKRRAAGVPTNEYRATGCECSHANAAVSALGKAAEWGSGCCMVSQKVLWQLGPESRSYCCPFVAVWAG